MNTLQLIKNQIQKQENLRRAQILHTVYRGVEYEVCGHEPKETHGTFCYRGHTYTK